MSDIVERLRKDAPSGMEGYDPTFDLRQEAATAIDARDAEIARLREALADSAKAEHSNARRMREAVVEARKRLAKGRSLWNGPCHECDAVLDQALRAENDADAIARAALKVSP